MQASARQRFLQWRKHVSHVDSAKMIVSLRAAVITVSARMVHAHAMINGVVPSVMLILQSAQVVSTTGLKLAAALAS